MERASLVDASKLKEFVDDNFTFDENGRRLFSRVENLLATGNFSFSHSAFKILVDL